MHTRTNLSLPYVLMSRLLLHSGNAMRYSGQSDHRVFVEVAYAYQNKFKFALCTDEQAITAFR